MLAGPQKIINNISTDFLKYNKKIFKNSFLISCEASGKLLAWFLKIQICEIIIAGIVIIFCSR